jgi:hypothetical protein
MCSKLPEFVYSKLTGIPCPFATGWLINWGATPIEQLGSWPNEFHWWTKPLHFAQNDTIELGAHVQQYLIDCGHWYIWSSQIDLIKIVIL